MKRRWAAAGFAVVLVAGGGTAYGVTQSDSGPRYRTVAAATGDVEQTLSTAGTVDAAHRADLGFGTDGTVAALKVAVGDVVAVGQVLAVLETADLDDAVTEARASVARAVAQLAADREAQNAAVEDAVEQAEQSTGTDTPQPDGATAKALRELQRLQDAVIEAQQKASAGLAAATSALAAQTAACTQAPAVAEEDGDAETIEPAATSEACSIALATVQDRQQEVSEAQDALATALAGLSGALTKALSAATTPEQPAAARTEEASTGPEAGGTTVTAARLAADQAAIAQAEADLVAAEQARGQATLRSTRSGRVVDVAAAVGDPVSAGDTVATVVGGTAVTIQGAVTEEQVDQVKVGQTVRVTAPGSSEAAEGRVAAIGLVADSSTGTTSYPVTVTVENPAIALPTGSNALLQIVLSTAKDVVTVPTSAVSGQDDQHTVQVWDGTRLSTEPVTLGAVGARHVEVLDGLEAGDRVVLAAIDDPIDGASSTINDRGGFGVNGPPIEFRQGGPGGGGAVTFRSGP